MTTANKITTPLDNFYKWENKKPNKTFLIQPMKGKYIKYTWQEVGIQTRKIAEYINNLNDKYKYNQ